jgi:DHA1 family tetracycline resistance protein-like MFS transporter
MAVGAVNVAAQAGLVGPAVAKLGERGALRVGLLAGIVGFAFYALAPNTVLFGVGVVVFGVAALINPGLQGLMSRRVGPSEQGQLQGANSAIMGLTSIFGPQIFTGVFAWSVATHSLPGLAVLVAAALMGLAFCFTVGVAQAPESEPASAESASV